MEPLLTVSEAAVVLRVTEYTVRKWLRKGVLKGRKIEGVWRISRHELTAAPRENQLLKAA